MKKMNYLSLLMSLAVLFASGCSKEARSRRHLDSGDHDYAATRYDDAEVEYLNALRLAPGNVVAIRQLGLIYFDDGRLPRAFPYLQKAAESEPENIDVHLKLGLIYFNFRQLKEAREQADWVLAKKPGAPEAVLMLADMATSTKEIQDTRHILEAMRQKDQDRAIYHVAFATLDLRGTNLDQVGLEINKALAIESNSVAAQSVLGYYNWAKNDLPRAEQAFKAAAEAAPLRSPRRLQYADFKVKTGATADGKKGLEEITRQAPDYLPAWKYLMEIAFAEKKWNDCATLAAKIIAREPLDYDAQMMIGKVDLAQNDGGKAVAQFERLNDTYKGLPQVKYQLALAYLSVGSSERAASLLDEALQLQPDYTDAVLLRAELNLRTGSIAPAVVTLSQLVKQQPTLAKAQLLLANAYLMQKNPDQALVICRRMLVMFPTNAEIQFVVGSMFAGQKQIPEARAAFDKTLELFPDYPPAIEQLVNLDILEKKYSVAIDRAKNQMAKMPKSAGPWLLMAKIYDSEKNDAEVESSLIKAIQLDSNLRAGYLMLAQLYIREHKEQQALNRLNELVAKTNDVVALMQIGFIHEQLKQFPQARDAYEKLLTVDPNYSFVLNNLACLYSEKFGQLDKASKLAERARQLQPRDPNTADTLGWIVLKKGDAVRAVSLLEESASKLPNEPEVQFHLGVAHYMLGEEAPARQALQRAVDSNRDFSGKEECQQKLALLEMDVKNTGPSAVSELEKRSASTPNDPILLRRLAQIYKNGGNVASSVAAYEKVVQLTPNNPVAKVELAELYAGSANNHARALELARSARSLAPNDPQIAATLGRLVFEAGDYQYSLSLLQEASRQIPDDPNLRHDLALAYYQLGQISNAQSAMQSALESSKSFAHSQEASQFLTLVAAFQDEALTQKAGALASNILKTNLNYVPALMVTARVAESQGRYTEARKLYEQVLDHDSLFAPASRSLVLLGIAHFPADPKLYDVAMTARSAFPEDAAVAKAVGIVTYFRGDYTGAAQLLSTSGQQREKDGEVFYYLGMAQYKLKQQSASRQALQRALALNTIPAEMADEAHRVLGELK